jgi:hypothetical protein
MQVLALTLLLATGVDAGVADIDAERETAGIVASLQVRLEPDPVMFAEPFDVVIRVVRPPARALGLPTSFPEKKAVRRVGDPTRKVAPLRGPDGKPRPDRFVEETIRVPFVALDLEDGETPAFVVTAPDGTAIDIPSLPVRVANADGGVLDEVADTFARERTHHMYEVADPRPWVVLSGFASALMALGLIRTITRRRRFWFPAQAEAEPEPEIARRPAHEVALERLEALLAEGLLQKGEVPPFVQRLMDEVLRTYLEDRFDAPAGKRTTRELCEDLLGLSAPGLDVAGVRRILEAADLVKFAKADLATEVAHGMANDVRSLVEATRERREQKGGRA